MNIDMTRPLAAQASAEMLVKRLLTLEAEIAVLKERVIQLEQKPKRGRPPKNA